MEKGTVIIGIDPDNQESGVGAVFDDRKFLAYKMEFPALIDYLRAMNESCKKVKVVIEGGWINKSNWHMLGQYMRCSQGSSHRTLNRDEPSDRNPYRRMLQALQYTLRDYQAFEKNAGRERTEKSRKTNSPTS